MTRPARRPRTRDRDHALHVRCTGEELEAWRRAATSRGMSLSCWVAWQLGAASGGAPPPAPLEPRPSRRVERPAKRVKRLVLTNVAGRRPSAESARSSTLNVRATPPQYLRWRRAADRAGRSLSGWVAGWLDELAGVPSRVLSIVETLSPKWQGWVPVPEIELELVLRWGWSPLAVDHALSRLEELQLVRLRRAGGRPGVGRGVLGHGGLVRVTHIALASGTRAPAGGVPY